MSQKQNKRILISGGGTGGHIFPALAIANALKRHDPSTEILFVGACGRMEMERVPAAGYRIEGLPVAGFDRKKLWRNFGVALKLVRSMMRARGILSDFNPDIAIGVGGYASGPMLKEAQRRGIPTLIQEQNSYAGVTNKLLAKKADAICVAYDGMERFFPAAAIVKTGNPVRKEIADAPSIDQAEAKRRLGFDSSKPLVLVVGGSLGARTINDSIAAGIDRLTAGGNNQVMWQTGKLYAGECESAARGKAGVKATPFVSDMATAYSAADLVIARAGAGTISELQITGKAAILVPSPNVAEDHQRKNAMALVERGAAVMVPDNEARERLVDVALGLLADSGRRRSLAENVASMAMLDSDEKIVERIYQILEETK